MFLIVTAMEDSEESSSSAATPSRLMITKIVCKNFKSYAGEKVLGPFHKVKLHSLGVVPWFGPRPPLSPRFSRLVDVKSWTGCYTRTSLYVTF